MEEGEEGTGMDHDAHHIAHLVFVDSNSCREVSNNFRLKIKPGKVD